jgi:hypothetical protein
MSTSTPEKDAPANDVERDREQLEQRLRELESENARLRGPSRTDENEENRPWNVAAKNAGEEHMRDVAPLPYRGEGAVLHHFPHLTGGSGGPQEGPYVRALAELLAEVGYDSNEVIRGRVGYMENTLAGDVARFSRDHDVREHVAAYNGHPDPAEDVSKRLVGPYTVQAIFDKVAEKRGQDVASVIGQKEYEIGRAHQRARL